MPEAHTRSNFMYMLSAYPNYSKLGGIILTQAFSSPLCKRGVRGDFMKTEFESAKLSEGNLSCVPVQNFQGGGKRGGYFKYGMQTGQFQ